MNTVEQIRSYVERTKVKDGYSMGLREAQAILLAFEFGEAKRERYTRRARA